MGLFEKLNNKRYNLQEKKIKKSFSSGSFDAGNNEKKFVKPTKKQVRDIQNKSIKNQADAGNRAKTFRGSFGTPTGADPKTGKPTYKPSFTIDAKGNKKIGPDLGTGPDKKLPTTTGNTVPTDKTYDKVSKNLGDREAGKSRYIDPKTNKASPEGVKRYISKARQMRTGGDIPVDKKTTDVIATSAGGEYRDKIQRKYGGRRITLQGTKNTQPVKIQEPQSNARRNMNRTLKFKDLKQKFKNLGSNVSTKFSNFNKRLKDPTRGFAPYKSGKRAMAGNIYRKRGAIGYTALAAAIAAPHIKNYFDKKNLKKQGREKISPLNTKSSEPITDKTGKPVLFGFGTQGKPEGSRGNLLDPNVKSQVRKKIESGDYQVPNPFKKK